MNLIDIYEAKEKLSQAKGIEEKEVVLELENALTIMLNQGIKYFNLNDIKRHIYDEEVATKAQNILKNY